MSDTTQNNIVWGCPKHQGPLLGATLHRRNGPGQSCKLVDNAHTSQTHLFDARVPHNIRNAQCSAYNRTHLRKNASNPPRIMGWLHRAGEQSHPKRKWQHTVATHERPTSGSSPKHETLACGPPPSRKTCLQYASISPRRAARQPAHPARDLCTFATADRTDVQTPRDLITAANAKKQAGGRRGSGSNLHRN